jgi:hypothetical protein
VRRLKGLDFGDKKLIIKRIIIEHKLKPGFNQELLKEWTMSDILLKKDGYLYCCETIQEAQIK